MDFAREIRFTTTPDGVALAMALYGSGPVLIKAGNWLTHVELDLTTPIDRQLIGLFAPNHRYVTYDTRGCGLSQRSVGEVSLDAWVRDLETVAGAVDATRFTLLGISQGAAVAVAYAARHPERVERLVLVGGFATSYLSSGPVDPAVAAEAEALLRIIEVGWGSDSPVFREVFVAKFFPDATLEQRRAFDAVQKATVAPDVAARYLRAMFEIDVLAEAARVRCPTLALHMKGDQIVRFGQGRRLAAAIPGARFVPLDGNNHMPFDDEAAWPVFVDAVRDFLGLAAPPATAVLTARQREVLRRVAGGATDKEIARDLSLSPRTVEMHVGSAMRVLGARTRAQAVQRAGEQGQL